jgi:hypothetical protein
VAVALPFPDVVAVKDASALARERWDGWAVTVPVPRFRRRYLVAALAGELLAVIAILASDNVSPVLLRSLQLFLRF